MPEFCRKTLDPVLASELHIVALILYRKILDNLLTSVTDPLLHVTNYTYNAVHLRLTETNPRNFTTAYAYDALNRLTSFG